MRIANQFRAMRHLLLSLERSRLRLPRPGCGTGLARTMRDKELTSFHLKQRRNAILRHVTGSIDVSKTREWTEMCTAVLVFQQGRFCGVCEQSWRSRATDHKRVPSQGHQARQLRSPALDQKQAISPVILWAPGYVPLGPSLFNPRRFHPASAKRARLCSASHPSVRSSRTRRYHSRASRRFPSAKNVSA